MLSQNTQQGERQHDRFEISQNAALSVVIQRPAKNAATPITATPLDVSPSGVKLAMAESLGFGERVELQFIGRNDNGIDFTIAAEVRWIRQQDDKQAWVCGCSVGSDHTDAWFQELAAAGYVDRRVGKRIRSNVTAKFKFAGDPDLLTACILDYSSHGLCLASSEPIGSDRPLIITIQHDDDEPITLRAQSRWAMAFESGYMVGCELCPEDRHPQIPECSAADPMAKTHVMEKLIGEYDDSDSEPCADEEIVLDTQPLLETIEELIDEVDSPKTDHANDTVAIQPKVDTTATRPLPAFEPLPVNDADHELPLAAEEEPAAEEALADESESEIVETQPGGANSVESDQPPSEEPILVVEAIETTFDEQVADELSTSLEPGCEADQVAKPRPRQRSHARSIALFLLIEVALGGYFGAFYLNWDRNQEAMSASADAPRSYRYLQSVSKVVFYPAEKFESLFETEGSVESR